jgi:hypothetical protein
MYDLSGWCVEVRVDGEDWVWWSERGRGRRERGERE